ncbi:MAG: carboxypeptidase regulatory-like domain-containing protein, partial [Clostridia bacterium]|nr:carboxypeptidase regulatory-like domain-containing protein [Clostridia bacterium]
MFWENGKSTFFSAPPESGVNVSLQQDGQYTVEVAVDVRMMEVVIELDEENRSLYINPEKLTHLTSDGRVVTPTGEAYHREGTIVTPGGVVITADGTVVAPASEGPLGIALLTPENQVVYPEQDAALPDGTQLLENGNILLPGKTVIEKNENGTVILTPDGQRGQPGAGGVVISGDNQVLPIGAGTNVNGNSRGPDESASGNGYEPGTDQAEQNDASQNGDGSGGGIAGPELEERGENSAGSEAG